MALDRVGFIADVLRFPLADAPRLSPAQAWERAASCTDLEDISLLPLRGFVVLRKAIDAADIEHALAVLHANPNVSKVENGGRVYSDQLSFHSFGRRFRNRLADGLHSMDDLEVLPPSYATGGGRAEQLDVRDGMQFVSTDKAKAKASLCPGDCIGDWHVDGAGQNGIGVHKLWLLVDKEPGTEQRALSNIKLAPLAATVEDDPLRHSGVLPRSAVAQCVPHTDGFAACQAAELARVRRLQYNAAFLEEVGCVPALDPGDAIFFLSNVLHRTQDMLADRVAMLINVT
uniref:Uncharacterized protein n=1 Tax=Haptolina ericina TaxID=156174 RepID=A0A6T9KSW9_9EUKA